MLSIMDSVDQHTRQIVDQFSRQAVYFAKLPDHEEATELFLRMAGLTAADDARCRVWGRCRGVCRGSAGA